MINVVCRKLCRYLVKLKNVISLFLKQGAGSRDQAGHSKDDHGDNRIGHISASLLLKCLYHNALLFENE